MLETGDTITQVSDAPLLPWDPQPGEPGTSFAGLVLYRETPPPNRNLKSVAARLGRSLSLVERYSGRWGWVERARAWEVEKARSHARQARQVEADWVQRHADAGKRLQALGLAGLAQVLGRDENGELTGLRRLKAPDLVRMVTAGSALEVTAALHLAGSLEAEFVQRVVDLVAAVFAEANRYEDAEARAEAFQAGCLRALQDVVS